MLLSLCRFQLRRIHHASINIATSFLGARLWNDIWLISWSPTKYWRRLWLYSCVLWRVGWLLMNKGQQRWINNWTLQWRRHIYHQWWQLIAIWVTVLAIKSPITTNVATKNSLCMWHDKCNMSLWWCCVPAILFVDAQQKVGANFSAQ